MSSSSDSDDKHKKKGFKIGSKGTPVRWDGEDWPFYKQSMMNAFEKSLLDGIVLDTETEGSSIEEKNDFKKKQAKVKILIQGSLSMRLTKQVVSKKTGTEMWAELCSIYDGTSNSATKAQKVYRLNGELHRTHLRANGDVRSHLYKMFEIMEQLKGLEAPVNDLQMVDILLRSLSNQMCYNELRRKVLFIARKRSRVQENDKQQKSNKDLKKKVNIVDVECFNCGSKGHYRSDCPDLLANNKQEKSTGRKTAQSKYARSRKERGGAERGASAEQIDESPEHTPKRDVVISDMVTRVTKGYDPSRWYFDTGTNAHIVASKEYFTSLQSMDDSEWNPMVLGFSEDGIAQAEGFGTALLATMIDEQMVLVFLENVLYVPKAGCNLFSPGQALTQGFKMTWDQDTELFGMSKDGIEVIRTSYEHQLWTFESQNVGTGKVKKNKVTTKKQVLANFTVTDGVADIDLWHARLGHTCPEYIRLMVDRSMAKGIMLKKRGKIDCADCHFGKQKRKTFQENLDREITRVNDVVFADLLIPGLYNGTQYTAVLVIMDGFSRFVTTYLLKSKTGEEVNRFIKQYIAWAERQHGKRVESVVIREWHDEEPDNRLVKQVLTDKGQEFCNGAMERWYEQKGIVHKKVGPKASQLNLVERTHQTLEGMVKTMMHDSGLPRSMWIYALETAVYVKNRVFCKGAGRTPYEVMFNSLPDLHHIRTFGSLVYCHTPIAKRTKLIMNCRVGFLLGYREDVVGYRVYFPTEHKTGFVADVKINESIKYKDRYGSAFKSKVDKWLQTFDEYVQDGDLNENEDEDGNFSENQADNEASALSNEIDDVDMIVDAVGDDDASSINWNGEDKQLWDEILLNSAQPNTASEDVNRASDLSAEDRQLWNEILENSSLPDCDSEVAFEETQGGDDNSVASSTKSQEDAGSEGANSEFDSEGEDNEDTDSKAVEIGDENVTDLVEAADDEDVSDDEADYDCLFDPDDELEAENCLYDPSDELAAGDEDPPLELLIGRRRLRDDSVKRAREPKRAKVEVKKQKEDNQVRRPGLRELHERHPPDRYQDFAVTSAFKALHADRRGNCGILASSVKIPRTYREAMRSKYAEQWKAAMDDEMQALKDKEVLCMIPKADMPVGQRAIKTMWVYDLKSDHLGYIIRFKARIVARGDKQRQGIDYLETFSPVARMATFRLFLAACVLLQLVIYQGDINTAYLNAILQIKQYLEGLEGYPCDEKDKIYMINRALYGLRQSGREWNSEVNNWLIRYGFKQCSTEPCLYFYEHDGNFALILLYVDDILCATKDEEFKKKLFSALNDDYGIKDQGLIGTYLGVEVEQSDYCIKIHQTHYCEEVIEKFNFGEAHASRIPMETKLRLAVNATDQHNQELAYGKVFPYRELVGSLMYLATCTRPDIAFAVGQLSRYVQHPTQQHIGAAKRVLRYLVGTKTLGIVYSKDKRSPVTDTIVIDGYCDSDWGNDPDTRKSVTGYVHCVAGGAVSWASKRQTIVAQSTTEAEYVAACESCVEGQGLRNVLIEVFPALTTKFCLGIDNQAAYVMATNPTFSRRTRHIELRWHYVRDQVTKKTVNLHKVKTEVNPSDLLTKPLAGDRLETLSKMIGLTKEHLPK